MSHLETTRALAARRAYGPAKDETADVKKPVVRVSSDELVRKYSPLVYRIAKRVRRRTGYAVELEELVCEGTIGLLQAAERFDHRLDTDFEHLASVRVQGAMLDALRRLDPLSQRRRREARRHNEVRRKLENGLGRSPADDEMAQALGMELDDYFKLSAELATPIPVRFEDVMGEARTESRTPEMLFRNQERAAQIKAEIMTLNERAKLVLSLIYFEELSQKEAAQVLQVTEARVSQLHKEALEKLRRRMKLRCRVDEDAW